MRDTLWHSIVIALSGGRIARIARMALRGPTDAMPQRCPPTRSRDTCQAGRQGHTHARYRRRSRGRDFTDREGVGRTAAPHHSPRVDIDARALAIGSDRAGGVGARGGGESGAERVQRAVSTSTAPTRTGWAPAARSGGESCERKLQRSFADSLQCLCWPARAGAGKMTAVR